MDIIELMLSKYAHFVLPTANCAPSPDGDQPNVNGEGPGKELHKTSHRETILRASSILPIGVTNVYNHVSFIVS